MLYIFSAVTFTFIMHCILNGKMFNCLIINKKGVKLKMADSNIKLRDRIVSGVLALLIPILGLNIGSSFNSAEAVSYNDESTNNLSVAQHSTENTDNKITLTLNAITKGKSSNIPVPNTVFKYKVYADIDKRILFLMKRLLIQAVMAKQKLN